MFKIQTFLFLVILPFLSGISQTIETIEFAGITKTNPTYLRALIESKIGNELDSLTVEKDVQTLKNLNLFFSVDRAYTINKNGKYALVFKIEEAVYIYPILTVSGFKNQFKVQAGCNQINFLGKAQSIGVLYQFYDRHSLSFFYTAPKHSNGKTGHEFALSKYSTIEPLYSNDTVSSFNFDNYSVSLGGFYWPYKNLRFGLGGMFMYEKYEQVDQADIGVMGKLFEFNKYQIRFRTDYMAINQHYEFREGKAINFYSEIIQTEGFPTASFLKFTSDFTYFKRIKQKGNFGFHTKLGISTNNKSPFSPFVLDGFINVRGIGNRVARGTAEIILNTEYRHTLLKKKYFIAQIAAFADYGALREPGGNLATLFNTPETNIFIGGGIRIHSQFIYKTIFRLDFSVNPTNWMRGFTFGLGQFF